MHLTTTSNFILSILGITSQFAYGFSLKPHSPKTFDAIASTYNNPTLGNKQYGSIAMIPPNPITMRGGSRASAISSESKDGGGVDATSRKIVNSVASLWAAGGVIMILGKSIKRILPIALEPFNGASNPLSTFQLGSYIGMCLWFAYVEGFKGFQLKFSPLVVARAQTLKPFQKGSPIHHTILGPFYAMGLFHATKKRKIISWSVTIGVAFIVAAVKRLPYPWRNIIDAGVIVGLSWGSLSIAIQWLKAAILGIDANTDPALPEAKGE